MVAKHVNKKNGGKPRVLAINSLPTLTCCPCYNLQCCGFLWLPLIIMQSHRQSVFSRIWCITNPTPSRWVTPPWNVYMAKFDPGWGGYLVWQTGLLALAGQPTYHVSVFKLKWEIIWTGGLPHLHVNRPQDPSSSAWLFIFFLGRF